MPFRHDIYAFFAVFMPRKYQDFFFILQQTTSLSLEIYRTFFVNISPLIPLNGLSTLKLFDLDSPVEDVDEWTFLQQIQPM